MASNLQEFNPPSGGGVISISSSSTSTSTSVSASGSGSELPSSVRITPSTTVATDIWRKPGPPLVETFNAPLLYRRMKLREFGSVGVKVSASWNTLYDQGGLVFVIPSADSKDDAGDRKWVKTGIEFYEGREYVSTVCCDRWADWSLVGVGIQEVKDGRRGVELLMERKEKDDTLWVYVLSGDKKIPIRECTWPLSESVVGGGEDREIWVGVYAATPKGMESGAREELEVLFEDLKFEIRN